ncbi:hypothetical protein CKO31_08785 [Thiohalocapsa halophila]|uniref:DUF4160 domain-containing protein n=1 Tax=Thiohalocapsa halophila TaxID=69359 RepID=A0ABS1CHI8_9GAMM|nr:DUF4160 domain-containing protein [Thiohalocapsa halophila]MBK1630836.1 hypothetical protein [Thiohalocapsa halophila]
MPTILRAGPYRFFFYAGDGGEPVHVHIERDDKVAKFWLDPIRLQNTGGFTRAELRRIRSIITAHQATLVEGWHEFFGDKH